MVLVPRANVSVAPVWLSLRWSPESGDPSSLFASAANLGVPLELSRNSALWRSALDDETFVVSIGGREAENLTDEEGAANQIEASLFQASCSLGHRLDLFALDVRKPWADAQMRGAFAAMEMARSDGLIRFFGLHCPNAETLLEVWRNHDGFEFVFLPSDQWTSEASDLCLQRGAAGVAVVEDPSRPATRLAGIRLVSLRMAEDAEKILRRFGDC